MQITPTAVTDGLALQLLFHGAFRSHLSGAISSVASAMQPFLCGCDRTQCHTQLMASRSPRPRRVHRQDRHPFLCRRRMSICLPTCTFLVRLLGPHNPSPVTGSPPPGPLASGVTSQPGTSVDIQKEQENRTRTGRPRKVGREVEDDVSLGNLTLRPGRGPPEPRHRDGRTRGGGRRERVGPNVPFPHSPLFPLARGSREKRESRPPARLRPSHGSGSLPLRAVGRGFAVCPSGRVRFVLAVPTPCPCDGAFHVLNARTCLSQET